MRGRKTERDRETERGRDRVTVAFFLSYGDDCDAGL